ncbi:hypothetical protein GGF31_001428 [Allomyces arbusculus]|nr:hypothetical protein GGF31_001428 [Allomyces arbusculus]
MVMSTAWSSRRPTGVAGADVERLAATRTASDVTQPLAAAVAAVGAVAREPPVPSPTVSRARSIHRPLRRAASASSASSRRASPATSLNRARFQPSPAPSDASSRQGSSASLATPPRPITGLPSATVAKRANHVVAPTRPVHAAAAAATVDPMPLIVTNLLTTIAVANDALLRRSTLSTSTQLHAAAGKFRSPSVRALPTLSLAAYAARFTRYAPVPSAVWLAALILIDRVASGGAPAPQVVVCTANVHRLLLVAMVVATKAHSDVFYTNKHAARVGGIPLAELNALEREMLATLEYRAHVDADEFAKYAARLAAHSAAAARVAAAGMVPAPSTPARPVVTPPSPPLTPDMPKPAVSDLVPVTRVDDASALPTAATASPADGVASV